MRRTTTSAQPDSAAGLAAAAKARTELLLSGHMTMKTYLASLTPSCASSMANTPHYYVANMNAAFAKMADTARKEHITITGVSTRAMGEDSANSGRVWVHLSTYQNHTNGWELWKYVNGSWKNDACSP